MIKRIEPDGHVCDRCGEPAAEVLHLWFGDDDQDEVEPLVMAHCEAFAARLAARPPCPRPRPKAPPKACDFDCECGAKAVEWWGSDAVCKRCWAELAAEFDAQEDPPGLGVEYFLRMKTRNDNPA